MRLLRLQTLSTTVEWKCIVCGHVHAISPLDQLKGVHTLDELRGMHSLARGKGDDDPTPR